MSDKYAKLTCFGGVGSVTGANFLFEIGGKKYLIDCGLEQGGTEAEKKNYEPFPFDPKEIDSLFVTHAHMDHIGRIPKLIEMGFSGTIYSTPATKEISALMFDDAIKIMMYDYEKYGTRPLYERPSIGRALSLWKEVDYHTDFEVNDLKINFKNSGHILGSSMISIKHKDGNNTIMFTGDLGNSPAPLLIDTEEIGNVQYLVMESVYGDRNHDPKDERDRKLQSTIKKTLDRGGTVLIPAFSLERTQVILYEINNMVEEGKIPSVPVYLDSPLAIKVTGVYRRYRKQFNDLIQKEMKEGDDIFDFPRLTLVKDVVDSSAIHSNPGAKIIIAGSGMSAGGRIQSHEKVYLSDPQNSLIFVGYQAVGTLGRLLLEGLKRIKIEDSYVNVKCEIISILGYSSHKDSDGLVSFVGTGKKTLKKVFVAMGEPKSSLYLSQRIRDEYDINALYPEKGKVYDVEL